MLQEIVNTINRRTKTSPFLDFSIFSYNKSELIIAVSEDFSYNHLFEIRFKNVFTIIANINWTIDVKKDSFKIIEDYKEASDLNLKYKVEAGNTIFQFLTEDGDQFYIIAKEVEYVDKVVRYFNA